MRHFLDVVRALSLVLFVQPVRAMLVTATLGLTLSAGHAIATPTPPDTSPLEMTYTTSLSLPDGLEGSLFLYHPSIGYLDVIDLRGKQLAVYFSPGLSGFNLQQLGGSTVEVDPRNPAQLILGGGKLTFFDLAQQQHWPLRGRVSNEARPVFAYVDVTWAPDGRHLTILDGPQRSAVWARQTHQLTSFNVTHASLNIPDLRSALWSPDGTQVAFIGSWREGTQEQTPSRTLVSVPAGCWETSVCPATILLPPSDPSIDVAQAQWMPDSQQILLAAAVGADARLPSTYDLTLMLLNVADGTTTPVVRSRDIAAFLGAAPRPTHADAVTYVSPPTIVDMALSPDGRHVALFFFYYTATETTPDTPLGVSSEVQVVIVGLADGAIVPTGYIFQAAYDTSSSLAWGPPLPDGVLPTPPPSPTPTE